MDGSEGLGMDIHALLKEMREVSLTAAADYLEHIVVIRRSTVSR